MGVQLKFRKICCHSIWGILKSLHNKLESHTNFHKKSCHSIQVIWKSYHNNCCHKVLTSPPANIFTLSVYILISRAKILLLQPEDQKSLNELGYLTKIFQWDRNLRLHRHKLYAKAEVNVHFRPFSFPPQITSMFCLLPHFYFSFV